MEKLRQEGGGDKINSEVNLNSSHSILKGKLRHSHAHEGNRVLEALPCHEGM